MKKAILRAASPGEGFAVVVPGDERLEAAALEGERRLLAPYDLMDAPVGRALRRIFAPTAVRRLRSSPRWGLN